MAKFLDPRNTAPEYSVGLNIVLSGSGKLSPEELDTFSKDEPRMVRVMIYDAEDTDRVLVNTTVFPRRFSSGNVGYALHTKKLCFGS